MVLRIPTTPSVVGVRLFAQAVVGENSGITRLTNAVGDRVVR